MVRRISLYRTQIHHRRSHPVSHTFSYPGYWWLLTIDQDAGLPYRLLTRLKSQDYCGDPKLPIAANIREYLTDNGCDATDLDISMLTTPRQLGYAFNPITVFYCSRKDGRPVACVAEVHNTYGGRHRYFLEPDSQDWSHITKQLYVSPFYDVSGSYRIHSPAPGATLSLTVQLNRDGEPPFVAAVTGDRVPLTPRTIAASLIVGSPLLTMARIRFQGIRLWLKQLAVQPRQPMIGGSDG